MERLVLVKAANLPPPPPQLQLGSFSPALTLRGSLPFQRKYFVNDVFTLESVN